MVDSGLAKRLGCRPHRARFNGIDGLFVWALHRFLEAFDACLARKCRVVPGGGLSTAARIDLIQSAGCSVLFSTPSYTLHLAEEALKRGIQPSELGIRQLFVAGEPGGSIPAIRQRIESTFNATLFDHAGATEVGPWGIGSADGKAMHVNEEEFLAEFIPYEKNTVEDVCDDLGPNAAPSLELVLTCLGRFAHPPCATGPEISFDPLGITEIRRAS